MCMMPGGGIPSRIFSQNDFTHRQFDWGLLKIIILLLDNNFRKTLIL